MQILAIADDDSLICKLAGAQPDVLISLGDMSDAALIRAMDFYQPHVTFAVRGNHDSIAPFPKGVIDLHCQVHTYEGVRFGGFAGSWKYKPKGNHLFAQSEATVLLRNFPPVDIFAAHNSPAGVHERDRETHQGFDALVDYVFRCEPPCILHGHQHVSKATRHGGTMIVGVFGERLLDLDFEPQAVE